MKWIRMSLTKGKNLRKAGKVLFALAALLLLGATGLALAQGPDYTLERWTVDGGGYTFSRDGEYTLGGTVGQPDADVLGDGDYTLAGGFWGGGGAVQYRIYLPLVLRNY